jgi:uncharacterized Ntn-hydrolase superfamily protein
VTYSIVARDPDTRELGVGVQTCFFAVGADVPWARAGVGAVATQSFSEGAYGPGCLDLLEGGASAADALADVRRADSLASRRQVGVVDAAGRVAAFTGEHCVDFAGHLVGDGYSVQANMMAGPDVCRAMAGGFEAANGSLGERLLAGLFAAEAAGGDARGRMSAALVVVEGDRAAQPGEGRVIDIRVDHHDRPLDELHGLLRVATAYRGHARAVAALMAGDGDGALAQLESSLRLLASDENLRFLRACALIVAGRAADGAEEIRGLVAARPSWATVVRSSAAQGLFARSVDLDLEAVLGP